jgi:hypothetical protein
MLVAGVASLFEYTATHAPVMVKEGTQYWIEIINRSGRRWFWAPSFDGDMTCVIDGIRGVSPPDGYDPSDIQTGFDFNFCFDVAFKAGDGNRRLDDGGGVDLPNSFTSLLNEE